MVTIHAPRRFLCLLLLGIGSRGRFADAYDVLIRTSEQSAFYAPIKNNGGSGEVIGEMLQNPFFDPITKERIGTGRGFGFNINPGHTFINGTGTDEAEYVNSNRIWYLEGGTLNLLNKAIVSGTGEYAKYTGGQVEQNVVQYEDNAFVVHVTFLEPEGVENDTEEDDEDSEITLRLESEGGYYEAINDKSENQIGALYQNIIYDANSNVRVGTNQGYSYHFPNETFIAELGYSEIELWNGNRQFLFEDGSMDIFNRVVVHGTGRYKKYSGTMFNEKTISADPTYVGEITLVPASIAKSDGEGRGPTLNDERKPYDFRITSEVGLFDPILSPNAIGERFQNPVFGPQGKRIGTHQGYGFSFPADDMNYTTSIQVRNRIFYLEGGELNVMNQFVVAGTGIYENFTGGTLDENILSYDPFVSENTLIPPTGGDGDVAVDEVESSEGFIKSIVSWNVQLGVWFGYVLVAGIL